MARIVQRQKEGGLMEDNSFILDTMVWSYSRLSSFDNCKYAWKRHYIECEQEENNAFAEAGTLAHSLIERYSKGELDAFDMADEYENSFDDAVPDRFPPNKYVDLRQSYFEKGMKYFESFTGVLPTDYEVLGVEKKVEFEIAGKPFVGYIDLLVRDEDGSIICVDHKSSSIKLLKTGKPSKSCAEKMLGYQRQLYLYCKALIDDGIKPDFLCWNFFNDGVLYKIPFDETEYNEAIRWAEETIKTIEAETEFEPRIDFYYCHNLCGYRHNCEHCVWENWSEDEHYEP